jgi:hypothetical protein
MDPGLPLVPVWKGSILHLIDSNKSEQASSLKSSERQKYDREYSSDDICFPLVKGFHREDIPNYKIDSPRVKYQEIHED